MSWQEIDLTLSDDPLPEDVVRLIEVAKLRQDEFYDAGLGLRFPKYVPSDPKVVYAAIAFLKDNGHIEGNVFCEWGCGFAIATGIASLVGMDAIGIEIEDELFERATALMKELDIPAEILQTDYLPWGFDEIQEMGGKELIPPESISTAGTEIAPPQYDGLDPDEVDLFFVYPWPDQEEMMLDLFMALSSQGAVLLMYQGEGEISAYMNDVGRHY